MSTGSIRVFLVDDHAVVRRGMRAFLDALDGFEVVDEAGDGEQALGRLGVLAATGSLPDVVLMDLVMPRMDGITATAAIKRSFPDVEVVAVTSFLEEQRVHAALEAGAAGYLLKDAEADELAAAIRAAHRGEVHLDPVIARQLTRTLRPATPSASLTDREREVLRLVALGRSNKQIAEVLMVSERTARTHVSHILAKLGLASRTQAALWAVREGFAG